MRSRELEASLRAIHRENGGTYEVLVEGRSIVEVCNQLDDVVVLKLEKEEKEEDEVEDSTSERIRTKIEEGLREATSGMIEMRGKMERIFDAFEGRIESLEDRVDDLESDEKIGETKRVLDNL